MFNFDQVGKEIKGWAKALAIIVFIMFVLAGIAVMTMLRAGSIGLLIGVVVVALGYVVARLSAILLYGFGELVDKAMDIDSRMTRMEQRGAAGQGASRPAAPGTPQPNPAMQSTPGYQAAAVTPIVVDSLRVQCPHCRTIQMKNSAHCAGCGVPMTHT